jgi:hypothetical protein
MPVAHNQADNILPTLQQIITWSMPIPFPLKIHSQIDVKVLIYYTTNKRKLKIFRSIQKISKKDSCLTQGYCFLLFYSYD